MDEGGGGGGVVGVGREGDVHENLPEPEDSRPGSIGYAPMWPLRATFYRISIFTRFVLLSGIKIEGSPSGLSDS